jgi:hypothetical protein
VSSKVALLPLAVAALAVAAPAQAATLVGDQSCYREGEPVNVVANGFTPNGVVNFSRDNQALTGSPTADAAGTVRASTAAPRITPALQRAFVLEARDATNPAIAASINPLATRFGVTVSPKSGNPARKRRIKARGFTEGKTLYVHVRRGGKGKNIKLGRLKKPCGNKSVKKRIFKRHAKTGIYTVQFDTRRRYRSKASPKVTYLVTVFRTFRSSVASSSAFGELRERWVQVR